MDNNAQIFLSIGRDLIDKLIDQCLGPIGAYCAYRLNLGWVVVGNVRFGGIRKQDVGNVNL